MSVPGIGGELTRAREARGRTLEDAERDTRISQRYLQALEDERFDIIPAPVYARGFLRSYAQYLGLDPGPLLARFPREDSAPAAGSAERPGGATPARFFPPREPTIGVDIGLAGGGGRMRGGPLPGARAVTVALVAVFVTAIVILLAFVVANLGGGESAPAPATPPAATPAPAPGAATGVETEIGIVPDVIGQTEAVARQAVREAGFEVNVVTERNEQYPRGTVFEQAPAAGVRREPGRSVFVVVSAGP